MTYRRTGRSGLLLPAISLGLWHNFGDDVPVDVQRSILRRAFDRGITHFDLANNYGPPYGSAEETFGRILATDLRPHRDELVISTKAGYDMWAGPYGEWGSRKQLLASLDQSLKRMGLDYVDIFYSHRFDPETPLEETLGALDTAVRQGKALYAGISSYSAKTTEAAAQIMAGLGTPILIHQPSYSMLNRWIEGGLLDVLDDRGIGCIVFSPLAQGLLSSKYLEGVPEGSRARRRGSLTPEMLAETTLAKIRGLHQLAAGAQRTQAGTPSLYQRRVLLRRGHEHRGPLAGHVHSHVRVQPHGGVDLRRRGAGEQQPADPALRDLHRSSRPPTPARGLRLRVAGPARWVERQTWLDAAQRLIPLSVASRSIASNSSEAKSSRSRAARFSSS
jgi:L-glyceraldehyde 3-phosphate reductase